ncbi:nitroreductase [Alicyclobacillus cycloheptanicus]|uniref:Putative NAD(P)H nitroreductase n=1 Tax=Alicyclobacillus cycloheptanicus TaxID=1457 RepID=A0ABT9XKP5_9BACL|nr:nitroreductase [Alicyclobacillus cycloheptanicus]MDQ0190353.1 nitroreductase [Alicyclobacillus cycloheptanicus]WDM00010.1 nitroreductase [Alicyclobacillus cycloheptanicus]
MDVLEAIRTRRSWGAVHKDVLPSDEDIQQILAAGTFAPTHHRTEPWRFFVMKGEGRARLGHVLAEIALEKAAGLPEAEQEDIKAKAFAKVLRAPVIIAITVVPSEDERVEWIEEVEAGAAAAQNMLLAAHGLGYGAIWRTGKQAYHRKMKELFQLPERGQVVGFIYLGRPLHGDHLPAAVRTPVEQKTVWWSTES